MAANIVEEEKLECNGEQHPSQSKPQGLAGTGWRIDPNIPPYRNAKQHDAAAGSNLMGCQFIHVPAIGEITDRAIGDGQKQHHKPASKTIEHHESRKCPQSGGTPEFPRQGL